MTKDKMKKFYEEHKTQVIIAVGVIGSVALLAVVRSLAKDNDEEIEGWDDHNPEEYIMIPSNSYWKFNDERAYILADKSLLRVKEDGIVR